MKTVHASIPCVVWIDATVEVQDDANKDDIFDIVKNRLRDLSELRRHAVSVTPYRELGLTDDSLNCEWYFEIEPNDC
jgi:hypothetical protein